ncbi:MAG TPA: RimK family alpha-L-glutamate ligase [Verrucomicrobiales bacterium]|nr:RimK family alpha-L-glutamate ligase [Verrucomicrobiales bacterium]
MPRILFVVNNPDRWPLSLPEVEVVAARTYLTDPRYSTLRNCKVYNLLRSYAYQSLGYYVSLLAEARGHKPMPRISTIQDIKSQSLTRAISADLDELIQKTLKHVQPDEFTLSIYFSRNVAKRYDLLARRLFNLFPLPLIRAEFKRGEEGWQLQGINAISTSDIPDAHREHVVALAQDYFTKARAHPTRKSPPRHALAILADPGDPTKPSNAKALERFADAAEKLSFAVELIDRDDYGRVAEFDALFIRSTTAVDNYTYRFARRAEAEGLIVIDDPESIVKCTNKVFLAELLTRHRIPVPRTEILHRDNIAEVPRRLGFPLILKQPDSSFSLGVVKVDDEPAYLAKVEQLLEESDLLIAQEYMRTDFDWRIGIIDQKPLYACQYFMARGHWQIYNNEETGDDHTGDFKTIPIEMAPQRVVQTALRAANLIGSGLYGVDLKEVNGRCSIIEINDNPSIDAGVEDKMLRSYLYDRVMEVFARRLEAQREGRTIS